MNCLLLKPGDSITGDRYRLQLIRLSRELREKLRPEYEQRQDKVILLHDNARPHVAKVQNIWKRSNGMFYCIRRILYIDYLLLITDCFEGCNKSPVHFFRRNRKLDWIASKDESFFRDEIRKLRDGKK